MAWAMPSYRAFSVTSISFCASKVASTHRQPVTTVATDSACATGAQGGLEAPVRAALPWIFGILIGVLIALAVLHIGHAAVR